MITPQGLIKRRETMIAKYGSYEKYREAMACLGSKGGKGDNGKTHLRGWASRPDLVKKYNDQQKKS